MVAEKTAVLHPAHLVAAYASKPDPDSLSPAGQSTKIQPGRRHAAGPILAFIGAGVVLLGSAAVAFFQFAKPALSSEVTVGDEATVRSGSPSTGAEVAEPPSLVPSAPATEANPAASAPRDEVVRAEPAPSIPPAPPGGESAESPGSKPLDSASKDMPNPSPVRADGLIRKYPWDSAPTEIRKTIPIEGAPPAPTPVPRTEKPPPATKKKPNFGI